MRERFFTPRLRVKSYTELNAWLMDQAIAYAKAHRHPEFRDRTIWQVFERSVAAWSPIPDGLAPSGLMMRLSFAALIGGMLTLVATAPNLVVNAELVRQGEAGFHVCAGAA